MAQEIMPAFRLCPFHPGPSIGSDVAPVDARYIRLRRE